MNITKRNEVESKLSQVQLTMNTLVTVMGSTQKQSREFQLSDLTDKEISSIHSDVMWDVKSGMLMSDDRTENTTIDWKLNK